MSKVETDLRSVSELVKNENSSEKIKETMKKDLSSILLFWDKLSNEQQEKIISLLSIFLL